MNHFQLEPSWENGASVYSDTLVTLAFRDANVVATENESHDHLKPLEFGLPESLPDDALDANLGLGLNTEYAGLYQRLWLHDLRYTFTIQIRASGAGSVISYPQLRYWRH
jgi:hypothetical protein